MAIRYLRGKRTANAVPVLSRISMGAIGVCSAAMIVIFSVFNGLETLAKNSYRAFYSDVRISPNRGKFFPIDYKKLNTARRLGEVIIATPVIEDKVFAVNSEQQIVITLKGIENDYIRTTDLKAFLSSESADSVSTGHPYTAIAGSTILNQLGTDLNTLSEIVVNYADAKQIGTNIDPTAAIVSLRLHPAGKFEVDGEFDGKYVLAPLALTQNLFHQPGGCSMIEVKTKPGAEGNVKQELQKIYGSDFKIETRYEQNRTMYMVMAGEKLVVFAILVMVMFIATFNMVGALTMLVLKKQKDIAILRAMGAQDVTIKSVILLEGILWSLTGGIIGIVTGSIICLLQQQFKLIKMGQGFVVDAFPVELHFGDILVDLATLIAVGTIISWLPAMRATKVADPSLKST